MRRFVTLVTAAAALAGPATAQTACAVLRQVHVTAVADPGLAALRGPAAAGGGFQAKLAPSGYNCQINPNGAEPAEFACDRVLKDAPSVVAENVALQKDIQDCFRPPGFSPNAEGGRYYEYDSDMDEHTVVPDDPSCRMISYSASGGRGSYSARIIDSRELQPPVFACLKAHAKN